MKPPPYPSDIEIQTAIAFSGWQDERNPIKLTPGLYLFENRDGRWVEWWEHGSGIGWVGLKINPDGSTEDCSACILRLVKLA